MDCLCFNKVRRQLLCSNGTIQIKMQCLDCGRHGAAVKKQPGDEKLPFVDQDLWRNLQQREMETITRARLADKERRAEEYRQYLQSDRWFELRAKVLERDHYLCQSCLLRRANQVHHLTYEHIFAEFCFELVSICSDCHKRLHEASHV